MFHEYRNSQNSNRAWFLATLKRLSMKVDHLPLFVSPSSPFVSACQWIIHIVNVVCVCEVPHCRRNANVSILWYWLWLLHFTFRSCMLNVDYIINMHLFSSCMLYLVYLICKFSICSTTPIPTTPYWINAYRFYKFVYALFCSLILL